MDQFYLMRAAKALDQDKQVLKTLVSSYYSNDCETDRFSDFCNFDVLAKALLSSEWEKYDESTDWDKRDT